jgi:hypothetical protein
MVLRVIFGLIWYQGKVRIVIIGLILVVRDRMRGREET